MIRYTLKCPDGHGFESWFASAEAYDTLRAAGHVACPDCGSERVEKSLMAPRVQASRSAAPKPSLSTPKDPREVAMAKLRREIEEKSDYVGLNFAAEARAIHDGDAPARSIHGEARPDEARRLIEDGVPVAPLPFIPRSRTN